MFKLIILSILSFSASASAVLSIPTNSVDHIKNQINRTDLPKEEKKNLTTKVTFIDKAPSCGVAKMLNESLLEELDGHPSIMSTSTYLAIQTCNEKIKDSIANLITVKKINDIAIMGGLVTEVSRLHDSLVENVSSECEAIAKNTDITGNQALFVSSCMLNKINEFAQKLK